MRCERCGRELHPWPTGNHRTCAPKWWVHCISTSGNVGCEGFADLHREDQMAEARETLTEGREVEE